MGSEANRLHHFISHPCERCIYSDFSEGCRVCVLKKMWDSIFPGAGCAVCVELEVYGECSDCWEKENLCEEDSHE